MGHHPIYAQTPKANSERADMQKYLLPVLCRHPNVSVYGCGHIHNFQYIKKSGDNINYWVNSAAALSRSVQPMEGTRWCDSSTGFTIVSADKQQLTLYAINREGKILYTLPIKK